MQSPPAPPLTPGAVVGASQAPPACRVDDDFRPTAPGQSPGVSHAIEASDADMLQPPPAARGIDDFRLTAPGHSLGAGHAIEASDSDMLQPPTAAHRLDDFGPTALGHSPGVGHAVEASDTDILHLPPAAAPLAPGAMVGASQASTPCRVNDFRPKAPDHSPGVGHAIEASETEMLQSPPAAPLAPGAVVGTSQATPSRRVDDFGPKAPGHRLGVGHAIEASDTDMLQSPPAVPLAPGAVVGGSQAPPQHCACDFRPTKLGHSHNLGVGVYVEAADANVPSYCLDHSTFSEEEKVNPFIPTTTSLNPPSHH